MKTVGMLLLIPVATVVAAPFLAYTVANIAVDFVQSLRGKRER